MNTHNLLLAALLIAVISVSGCQESTPASTPAEPVLPNAELEGTGVVEEKGLIVDKLTFQNEDVSGEVTKNKLTKTAQVSLNIKMLDDVELSSAPSAVNLFCGIMSVAFFDPDSLASSSDGDGTTVTVTPADSSPLEGYTVTRMHLVFTDKENGEKIAECTSTGPDWDDISFEAHRTYDNPMFGAVIGEQGE